MPSPRPFHTFPLGGSKKQVPAVGSRVPGTRYLRPNPFLSRILQTRGARFRLGPQGPVSGPQRRFGTSYRVPGTRDL